MTTIAIRLDKAMFDGRKKISQSELSRRSGVPQPTISRILKGQGPMEPETATLVKLAKALKVSVEWLREGTEPLSLPQHGTAERHLGPRLDGPIEQAPPAGARFQRHWLTDEDAELLAEIRSLTEKNQKRLRTIIRGMKRDDVDLDAVDKL